MPETATLLIFAAAAAALVAIPGPNHIYIAARSLSQGRHAGIASALGVETGTLVRRALVNRASGGIYLALGAAAALAGGRRG